MLSAKDLEMKDSSDFSIDHHFPRLTFCQPM